MFLKSEMMFFSKERRFERRKMREKWERRKARRCKYLNVVLISCRNSGKGKVHKRKKKCGTLWRNYVRGKWSLQKEIKQCMKEFWRNNSVRIRNTVINIPERKSLGVFEMKYLRSTCGLSLRDGEKRENKKEMGR